MSIAPVHIGHKCQQVHSIQKEGLEQQSLGPVHSHEDVNDCQSRQKHQRYHQHLGCQDLDHISLATVQKNGYRIINIFLKLYNNI